MSRKYGQKGYQDSAELCAQYLAPVLDAIKFNYLPFSANPVGSAATLPKEVAYSEERLRPPPGYKDTTVPGIFSTVAQPCSATPRVGQFASYPTNSRCWGLKETSTARAKGCTTK